MMMPTSPTPAQIRGARGMLNGSMLDLARAVDVSVATVKRMEMAEPQPVSAGTREIVRAALERIGVVLLDDDGDGVGVRLRMVDATPRTMAFVAIAT